MRKERTQIVPFLIKSLTSDYSRSSRYVNITQQCFDVCWVQEDNLDLDTKSWMNHSNGIINQYGLFRIIKDLNLNAYN